MKSKNFCFNFLLNGHSYTLQKIFNLVYITNENNEDHDLTWPYIPDHPYRMLITGGSQSSKTNALLNLIKEKDDIDTIYRYAKDLNELKRF